MDNEQLWSVFLSNIKNELNNPHSFDIWFLDTKLVSIENGITTVLVPTAVHIRYLNTVYIQLMENAFNKVFNTNTSFYFISEESHDDDFNVINDIDLTDNTENVRNHRAANLNPKYTFDTFIVGESNKVASSVAAAVAEQPGKQFNPLFIYGKSGLGKTHLMQAIGNYVLKNSMENVLYVNSNTFLEEFVDSIKESGNSFKEKYRNIDVLIIDDIQFLANADKTQEEFFHTFNVLHQNNKQIIISSDRSPDDLKTLEERLRTRFNWGISVNINPPELELRKQILKSKLSELEVDSIISDDVIDYIANRATNDVRELEGTLKNLLATATILGNGVDIDLDFAISCLKNTNTVVKSKKRNVDNIINVVAKTFGVSSDEIISKSRKREIIFPRQIAMYLAREMTDLSFQKIGLYFGNKNHSTVMSSCEKVSQLIKTDEHLSTTIYKIKENI
ncbi:MAG: chromosomal replication initiator protein DnaA [Bacilli bacterium]